ncbi:MAG: XisH protein [Chthonomonadaceae bacterium]|nr:XisH protein [Chthonomonadaceae bacterium]
MPRKDHIHSAVKNALIKEGWTITHDPLFIEYGQEDMYKICMLISVQSGCWQRNAARRR